MKKIRPIIENLIFALKYVNKIDSKFIYILFLTTFLSAIDSIYSIIMLKVILDVLILNNINIFIKVVLILLMLSFLLDSLLKYLQDRIIVLKKVLIEQGTNLDIFQACLLYTSLHKYFQNRCKSCIAIRECSMCLNSFGAIGIEDNALTSEICKANRVAFCETLRKRAIINEAKEIIENINVEGGHYE